MEIGKIMDDFCHQFPSHARRIRPLALRDSNFRSICEDYGMALGAIEYWHHDKDAASGREEEFHRIAKELREEAFKYLETHSDN